MFENMTKKQLEKVDKDLRYFIKIANNLADTNLDNGNIEEVDRLEDMLDVLIKIDGVVYSRIQNF